MQKGIVRFLLSGFVIVLGVFAIACASAPSATTGKTLPPEISVTDAVAKRNAGAFILDVRESEEWNEFHVPNSKLIPLGTLAARVTELPRDKEIVVVCRSGNRSQSGRDILLKAGFTSVTSMAGGLTQWKSAGHPTVTGP
jgi:rhodanese-related sulfurtransferase